MVKRILCFGDSNTWGCSPRDSSRFDENTRWPMVMGSKLGRDYTVIEEGLNGRTVLNFSPVDLMANGVQCIDTILGKNIPVDIAIISLGLNDVFIGGEVTLKEIGEGISEIVDKVISIHREKGFSEPEIIIMSPSGFNREIDGIQFFELQINKLNGLPELYAHIAAEKGCLFFNTSLHASGSIIDGSHLEAESHMLLGEKLSEFILSRI